jgi:lipopolysaccharide/colanic/teichoic acid biosynthesis glycosyltransferase
MCWGEPLAVVGRAEHRDGAAVEAPAGAADRLLKRSLDVVAAAALLVLLAPTFLLVAAAILIDDGAPVLYRCRRVGQGGSELRMLKFRKMRRDAAGPPLTVAADPRFTRVGRLLAPSKLDELPQLWHVLRGDMSLVGPRPEDPTYVQLHPEPYADILRVKPGMTGLSQLAFVDESVLLDADDPNVSYLERVLPQKLELDRLYAANRSLRMDLQILCWTALVTLLRRRVAVHRGNGRLSVRRRPGGGPAAVLEGGGEA